MKNNYPLPRGLRNNNPLNIKINPANNWLGKVKNNSDGTFEQFDTIVYGFRAALVLIKKYIQVYKLDTIEKIIYRWSPDGNEKNYFAFVKRYSEILSKDIPLNWNFERQICELVYAMACFENGTHYMPSISVVYSAYTLLTKNND